jgi:hypothetical protein
VKRKGFALLSFGMSKWASDNEAWGEVWKIDLFVTDSDERTELGASWKKLAGAKFWGLMGPILDVTWRGGGWQWSLWPGKKNIENSSIF